MSEYIPNPMDWVADQVELYGRSGGTEGLTLRDTGLPCIIVTNRGWKTGAIRKTHLMRVLDGEASFVVGTRPPFPDQFSHHATEPRLICLLGSSQRRAPQSWWSRLCWPGCSPALSFLRNLFCRSALRTTDVHLFQFRRYLLHHRPQRIHLELVGDTAAKIRFEHDLA